MSKQFGILILSLILCGCNVTEDIRETVLGQEVKEEAVRIFPAASYELPDTLLCGRAFVVNGRYVVCKMDTREYSISVYDLEKGVVVNRILHYGNGPHEVIMPTFYIDNGCLYALDAAKNRLFLIPCGDFPDARVEKEWTLDVLSASVLAYKGRLLMLNPYYFENEEMGISNGEEMLIVTDGGNVPHKKNSLWAYNVVQGYLMYNVVEDKIAFANLIEPMIVLFGSDLSPFLKIVGPEDCHVRYIDRPVGELSFVESVCYSYLSACADSEYIYALYAGQELDVEDDSVDWDFTDHDIHLFQFDWDGNIVGSYILDGVTDFSSELSTGDEPGNVYVSTVYPDGKENLQILHFDLNNTSGK